MTTTLFKTVPVAAQPRRAWTWVNVILALVILLPCLYGFGTKFVEFLALAQGDAEGAFAMSPVLNYLLASSGFFCLFCWATLHGMFRDIEGPKEQLLVVEAKLDAREHETQGVVPHGN